MSNIHPELKEKNNNKLKVGFILISLILAIGLVFSSLFAFFSDIATGDTAITAGTIDLVANEIIVTQNGEALGAVGDGDNELENFNPGDVATIYFGVTNEGSKSAWLRPNVVFGGTIFDILENYITTYEAENGNYATTEEREAAMATYFHSNFRFLSGEIAQIDAASTTPIAFTGDFEWDYTGKKVTWTPATASGVISGDPATEDAENDSIPDLNGFIMLNQNHADIAFTLYFVPTANNEWQGATAEINFGIQALQYRNNTIAPDWSNAVTVPFGS